MTTDLLDDLRRHRHFQDAPTERDICAVDGLGWPCDASRALAALTEAQNAATSRDAALLAQGAEAVLHCEICGQKYGRSPQLPLQEDACSDCRSDARLDIVVKRLGGINATLALLSHPSKIRP